MTSEFDHYPGCRHRDPDNCSGCALTDTRQDAPNYAAWPLAYMENNRAIPAKWRAAFQAELDRTDNPAYVDNLKRTMAARGVRFTDGKPLVESVTRYVATYVNKEGRRTLMGAAQGRNTFATPEEAQAWIDAVTANNSAKTVHEVWGESSTFEVRPCPCYPKHFDPQTVWFD